jgi:Protein of unknown function (DUF4242)
MKVLRSSPAQEPAFLVERYLSASAAEGLASCVARVARGCAELTASEGGARPVRYLHSVYIPAEDTCFCVFQAPSAEAVRAVNEAAGFALERISSAVVMFHADTVHVPHQTKELL